MVGVQCFINTISSYSYFSTETYIAAVLSDTQREQIIITILCSFLSEPMKVTSYWHVISWLPKFNKPRHVVSNNGAF